MEFKIANVLLEDTQRCHDYADIYCRTPMPFVFGNNESLTMFAASRYDFSTYFGSLSLRKWKRYTKASAFSLHLDIEGDFQISLLAYNADFEYRICSHETFFTKKYTGNSSAGISIEIPKTVDADVVGFEITTLSECVFHSGAWFAEVSESDIKDVELSIATTTFKNEEYIKNNIVLFEKLLASGEDIASHLDIHIVDNGQTLSDSIVAHDEHIHLHRNPNTGGAGGFARGMIESLEQERKATHVLVMDDDVSVSPESFIRTYNLLKLVKDEYADAFISGAMISMQVQNEQIEDVGHIFDNATFGAVKDRIRVSDLNQIVCSEAVRFNRQRQYAAFWYCCIPASVIESQGLPMPFFVRGDDAEYGLRNPDRKFITMNGICVWHCAFGKSKFRASLECYLAIRNLLIIRAITPSCADIDVYGQLMLQNFETEIRKFNYDYCELMLEGVEDYLRGPDFLKQVDGAALIQEKSAKNAKSVDLGTKIPAEIGRLYDDGGKLPINDKVKMKLTHNGHVHISENSLSPVAGCMINEYGLYHESRLFMHKRMYYVNDDMSTGYVREMDRQRYKELVARKNNLEKDYKQQSETVDAEWREAASYLTSLSFWKEKLHIG